MVVEVSSGTGERLKRAEQTLTVTVTDDDEEQPGTPAAPEVETVSLTSVRVHWVAPANAGPEITDYDYQYRVKTPRGAWATFTDHLNTQTEVTITNLQENTEYEVQVRANNDEGDGDWSEPGIGETGPNAAPRFTSAAAFEIVENGTTAGQVVAVDDDLTDSNQPADPIQGYAIAGGVDMKHFSIANSGVLTFNAAPNFEAPLDELSSIPPNAARNNQYVVVVMAISGTDEREKTAKQTITITVENADEPPAKPDAPTVAAASPTRLRATWDAPANDGRPDVTDYDYRYRKLQVPPSGTWTEVTLDDDLAATEVVIMSLNTDTAYEVQVQANNAEGSSGWSRSGLGATPDVPVVTLVLTPDEIAENGESTVTATVEPASVLPFEVTVAAAAVTPAQAGDFTLSENATLTFAANATQSTGAVTITAVDNTVDEADKSVTVTGTPSDDVEVAAPDAQTLTITDDDVLAAVEADAPTVAEGDPATFTVTLTGGTTTAAVVLGYTVGGTATAGTDYTAPSGELTISAGVASGSITVATKADDDVLDPGETLAVTLDTGTTTAGGVQVDATPATTTINDTDEVTLAVAAGAAASEGDDVTFTVTLSGAVAADVELDWATADDTALAGEDYTKVENGHADLQSRRPADPDPHGDHPGGRGSGDDRVLRGHAERRQPAGRRGAERGRRHRHGDDRG